MSLAGWSTGVTMAGTQGCEPGNRTTGRSLGGKTDSKFLLREMRDMISSNQLNPLASLALYCALLETGVEGRRELSDLSRWGGTNVCPAPFIEEESGNRGQGLLRK